MPKFDTVRRVQHSAEKMYSVVSDIESYPEFLALCEGLEIISRNEKGGVELVQADMTIGYKSFTETFRSEVILDHKLKTIETKNIKGPFKYMINKWRFEALSNESSDIHFHIDYAFKNWAMETLMGGMFDKAFRTYAQSFEERANSI